MRVRSAVKFATLLAIAAVVAAACASQKQEKAVESAEEAKIAHEVSVDGSQKRAEYLKCVLDDASAAAMDPGSDAIAPGDLAHLSLVKCSSRLETSQDDFGMELLSGGQDVVRATAAATRATDTVRSAAAEKAVAVIVDVRRRRAAGAGQTVP